MSKNKLTKQEIINTVESEGLEFMRFLYIDNDGLIRGYCSHRDSVESDLDSGLAFAKVMPVFSALENIAPESAIGCTGELRCVPDLSTFRVLPYAESQGQVICDFTTREHEESELCARTALKKMLKKIPYRVVASFENEYYYARKNEEGFYVPFDNSVCFSTQGMQATEKIILDTAAALKAQGMHVEKYYPEYGPGQQELVIRYAEGMQAADNQVLFRETVRAVAAKHGVQASFMPKPFQGLAGSGCHLHVSFWNGDKNLFYDEKGSYDISDMARHFIGGVLEHIMALCAFTASTVTSYKRLVPHNWASAYACYGLDNREAAIRICSGQKGVEQVTTNLEFKPIDGTCNPYLALTALLAAGMDGINRGLDPGEAVIADPDNLTAEERDKRCIRRLPVNLFEATAALERDEFFTDFFGETMIREYIALKKYQWEEYHAQVTPWETKRYLEIY